MDIINHLCEIAPDAGTGMIKADGFFAFREAAYNGVMSKEHQSGKLKGRTIISRLGDARLRRSLYMAALVAKRFNLALKLFVERLENKGKS